MREVSFGQYYPSNSFVHKCDPRAKILFLIVYIVAVFLCKNFYALGACTALFIVVAMVSGVPFSSLLRSVKAVLFLLLFMALLNLFLYQGQTVLWSWKFITITKEAIYVEAKRRAEELVTQTQERINALKKASNEYMDESLRKTEEVMAEALANVRDTRMKFRAVTEAQEQRAAAAPVAAPAPDVDIEL